MKPGIHQVMKSVSSCTLCHGKGGIVVPALDVPDRKRIRVLLLGEQPDREAALKKKVMGIRNDPSLELLRRYVEQAPLSLDEVLYATAVLCVPKDQSRRANRPTTEEAKNCARHLNALIARIRPQLVITLGHTALLTLQQAHREWTDLRQFILNYDVGSVLDGHEFAIYPLYFPNESTLKARGEKRQIKDWQRIPSILESAERKTAAS